MFNLQLCRRKLAASMLLPCPGKGYVVSKPTAFQLSLSLYQSSGWGRFFPLLVSDFGGLAGGSETALGEEGSTCTATRTSSGFASGSVRATGSTFGSTASGSGSGSGSGSSSATAGPCASMAVGSSESCAGVAASNSIKLTPVGAWPVASSV